MTTVFNHKLEAIPAALAPLRRDFRRWLTRLGWPSANVDELVMVLNEAATNVVEHAYLDAETGEGRPLRIHAELVTPPGELNGLRQVVVEVTDAGRWRPAAAGPGNRGRGLQLMRTLAATVQIHPGRGGTRVRVVSHPAEPTALGVPADRIDQALHRHTAPWLGRRTQPVDGPHTHVTRRRVTADE
jgi:anti-sigma regulatory factor (Ser/Thr protein kinase)